MNSFEDMLGQRTFRFTPNMEVRHPIDPDANGVMFGLDQHTILIFEDPNDGYRSAAGPILSFVGDPYELGGSCHMGHLGIAVNCVLGTDNPEVHEGQTRILEVHDTESNKLIFRVGTINTDDYYPSFVAEWLPQNMAINGGAASSDEIDVHLAHCYQGEYVDVCKYGEDFCPAGISLTKAIARNNKQIAEAISLSLQKKAVAEKNVYPLDRKAHGLALAKACERASQADRELDHDIEEFRLGNWHAENGYTRVFGQEGWTFDRPPLNCLLQELAGARPYTSNFDDALVTRAEGWRWTACEIGYEDGVCLHLPLAILHSPFSSGGGPMVKSTGVTPALAMCAAGIKSQVD